jgi:hypothetical protein
MNKLIAVQVFAVVMSMTVASPLSERRSIDGNWCDQVTGVLTCTDYCQGLGYDIGYCHQSRMTCNCYHSQLPHSMLPRPHPIAEEIPGYAEFYERLQQIQTETDDENKQLY